MRSKNFIYLFTFLFFSNAFAENIQIQAKNITLDKDKVTTVFENDVVIKTKNKIIKSQYLKYNKKIGLLILKNNIIAEDNDNNIITAENAEFNENKEIFKTFGPTNIITSEKYIVKGKDIIIDNKRKTISSNEVTSINDPDVINYNLLVWFYNLKFCTSYILNNINKEYKGFNKFKSIITKHLKKSKQNYLKSIEEKRNYDKQKISSLYNMTDIIDLKSLRTIINNI